MAITGIIIFVFGVFIYHAYEKKNGGNRSQWIMGIGVLVFAIGYISERLDLRERCKRGDMAACDQLDLSTASQSTRYGDAPMPYGTPLRSPTRDPAPTTIRAAPARTPEVSTPTGIITAGPAIQNPALDSQQPAASRVAINPFNSIPNSVHPQWIYITRDNNRHYYIDLARIISNGARSFAHIATLQGYQEEHHIAEFDCRNMLYRSSAVRENLEFSVWWRIPVDSAGVALLNSACRR